MKIIIDIPEERLDSIKHFGIKQNEVSMLERALISGTPLNDLKAKISDIETYERDGCWVMADVWKVLNNIEQEVKHD